MKNLLFLLIAISLLSSLTACNKDGDSDNTYFEFKLDGADFKASGLLAYATNFSDYFAIYGVKDQTSSETCYISLPKGTTAGTYDLDDSDHAAYYVNASGEAFSTNWGASSGTVTIEKIDETQAKGTFQFTAYDSGTESVKRVISEGKFNVKFR